MTLDLDMPVVGPEWNSHGREMSGGRFPLQVEQAVLNPRSRLVPGVTTVTVHARYYALHGLTAHYAAENELSRAESQSLVRRCEVIMGAASLVDEHEASHLYGRPHGFAAMQDVLNGDDLDVDCVSTPGAYSTVAWGFWARISELNARCESSLRATLGSRLSATTIAPYIRRSSRC